MWEQGHTAIAACNSNVSEPKRERDFGVKQTTYLAQRGEDEGLLLYRDNSTGGDNVVVSMLRASTTASCFQTSAGRRTTPKTPVCTSVWLPGCGWRNMPESI